MNNLEIYKELYIKCQELDVEDAVELVLNAETEDEREFYEMTSNYILQLKQRKLIKQGIF